MPFLSQFQQSVHANLQQMCLQNRIQKFALPLAQLEQFSETLVLHTLLYFS